MKRRTLLFSLLTFGFFVGVACLSLYGQLFHAATHVGDTLPTDYYHFHWNFWWIRHALATGQNIYFTAGVLTPAVNNLAFHTLTPFWYPVWALIEPFAGTMIAMNAIVVLASALTGWVFFLLLRRMGAARPLALAGGVLLQTTPAMLLSAWLTNINYLSLFWIPLLLLLWDQLARVVSQPRRAVAWACAFGVALYGMMMTDYQFALFAAFLIAPFGVWTLFQHGGRLIAYGVLALSVFAALFWFVGALPYIAAFDRSGLSPMPIENAFGIPFPHGYVSRISPYTRSISLGALILPAVIIALVLRLFALRGMHRLPSSAPPAWLWFALIFPPLLLSLGATITIGGTSIQTPYVPFHTLFGGMFRVPARFAPVIVIAAWLFVAQTLSAFKLPRRIPRLAWAGLLLLVFADARLFEPMPLRPLPAVYNFYEDFRREPYDYAILDVPVAGGTGEAWVGEFPPMETQFFAMAHEKRVLNGSIARAPLGSFWHWLYDDPLLAWLGQRRYLEPENVRETLIRHTQAYPIGYIVIHQNYMDRASATIQEIVGYFNQLDDLLCFYAAEGDALVYRTFAHPDFPCDGRRPAPDSGGRMFWIDVGAPGDERYLGWGYHPSETIAGLTWRWTGAYPQADLYVDLDPRDYSVTVTMQAFAQTRRVTLLVDDAPIGEPVEVTPDGLGSYTWHIPADALGDGEHVKLSLTYDAALVPAEIGQGGDSRRLAVAVEMITFVPGS